MTQSDKAPHLPRLLAYLAADLFGFFCLTLGVAWFAVGKGAILDTFPLSNVEALASAAGGLAVIIWAMTRILQTLGRMAPPLPPRDD